MPRLQAHGGGGVISEPASVDPEAATRPPGEGHGPSTPRAAARADPRLIVALDRPDAVSGLDAARRIGDAACFYKIGLGMLTGGGLGLAVELKEAFGRRIFLDLKLFDIAATVEAAVRGLAPLGFDLLTVHGDPHVVRAALQGRGDAPTRILAVTVLTSLERADLDDGLIRAGSVHEIVVERAARAFEAGADGVIASPREAAAIRALPAAEGRLIVTPGVRPRGGAAHDQRRVATPAEALEAGADHVVVGRPILGATDPRAAALAILDTLPPR